MLFIYFNGIRTKKGEYVVEVSNTADGQPRLMNVSSAFFMKFPVELLTKRLDTVRNKELAEEMEAKKGFTLVKSIRRHFGKEMISTEPVTFETHLSEMSDRKFLTRSSLIDKDGIERYVQPGASYDTISMLCPLSSHLFAFATKLGEPAMVFIAAQDEKSKRKEDSEQDSIITLSNEARTKKYEIELLLNKDLFANQSMEIQSISANIQSLVQNARNMERELKAVGDFQAKILNEVQIQAAFEEIAAERRANTQSNIASSLLNNMQGNLKKAEDLKNRIHEIVETVTNSWKVIQERIEEKGNQQIENVVTSLIDAAKKSAEIGVISAGLPIEGELGNIAYARARLEHELAQTKSTETEDKAPTQTNQVPSKNITTPGKATQAPSEKIASSMQTASQVQPNTASEIKSTEPDGRSTAKSSGIMSTSASPKKTVSSMQTTIPQARLETVSEIKPTEPDGEPTIGNSATITAPPASATNEKEEAHVQAIEKADDKTKTLEEVPTVASVATTAATPTISPATRLPEEKLPPSLTQRLQKLSEKVDADLIEAVSLNSKIDTLNKEIEEEFKKIIPIVDAVLSARIQRNKEIVNWPTAKELIDKSKAAMTNGYTQWNWYYTNFPAHVISYLFTLLNESRRWDDVTFTSINTMQNSKPLSTYPIPDRASGMSSYTQVLLKINPKGIQRRIPLPSVIANHITEYVLGTPKPDDRLQTLCVPRPERSYRSKDAGAADLEFAERQVKKLSDVVHEVKQQLENTKEDLKNTIAKFEEARKTTVTLEQKKVANELQLKATVLDTRLQRLRATAEKVVATYASGEKLLAEKRRYFSDPNSSDEQEEVKTAQAPIIEKSNDEVAQSKLQTELKTCLVLGKKDKFCELFATANETVKGNIEKYCANQKKLGDKLKEFKKAINAKSEVTTPSMRK